MSVSILENIVDDHNHGPFWSEVLKAKRIIDNVIREQTIAVPLLLDAMNRGNFQQQQQQQQKSNTLDSNNTKNKKNNTTEEVVYDTSTDHYRTAQEAVAHVGEELAEGAGGAGGAGGAHGAEKTLTSATPVSPMRIQGRLSNVSFEVSNGGDLAHGLDVAVIQAKQIGIVTDIGKKILESTKILRDLKREISLERHGKQTTNWRKITLLLTQANLVNAHKFAPIEYQKFSQMLDHAGLMDSLIDALSKGSCASLSTTTEKAEKYREDDSDGEQKGEQQTHTKEYTFDSLRLEPLKTYCRTASNIGMALTNPILIKSAGIVLKIRTAQARRSWHHVNTALKEADAMEMVHPSIVSELHLAKETYHHWKRLESDEGKRIHQSFLLTVSVPTGSTVHECTVIVDGTKQTIFMLEGGKENQNQTTTTTTNKTNTPVKNRIKRTYYSQKKTISNGGIVIDLKNVHSVSVGSSNQRKLTLMVEKELTLGLDSMKSVQHLVKKGVTKGRGSGTGGLEGTERVEGVEQEKHKKKHKKIIKKYRTETYTLVFGCMEERNIFCFSILAMNHSDHVCFQYDGERWMSECVLEYDVMTMGGVASRQKYKTLIINLNTGTLEKKSKMKKNSSNNSSNKKKKTTRQLQITDESSSSSSSSSKKIMLLDEYFAVDVNTSDSTHNVVNIHDTLEKHERKRRTTNSKGTTENISRKRRLYKMEVIFSSPLIAQRFAGRVRALCSTNSHTPYPHTNIHAKHNNNYAKFLSGIRNKISQNVALQYRHQSLLLHQHRTPTPLSLYVTTWNAGGTKNPNQDTLQRWLDQNRSDCYVIGLQECGAPDAWWKGILTYLNSDLPIVRIHHNHKHRSKKKKNLKNETTNEAHVTDNLKNELLCDTCQTLIQKGRERRCCCCLKRRLCVYCCFSRVLLQSERNSTHNSEEEEDDDAKETKTKTALLCTYLCSQCMNAKNVQNESRIEYVSRDLMMKCTEEEKNKTSMNAMEETHSSSSAAAENEVNETIDMGEKESKYIQIALVTLQHIQLGIFIKNKFKTRLTNIDTSTVACGLGGVWGNKGGVGVSFCLDGCNTIGIVSAHLAARASHKRDMARNKDYYKIMRSMRIGSNGMRMQHRNSKMKSDLYMSVDHLLFLGDLNYRITYGAPGTENEFESVKGLVRERQFTELMMHDQLNGHRECGRSFVNFQESTVNFPPTYRMVKRKEKKQMTHEDVYLKYGNKKYQSPSYCDRILHLSHLSMSKRREGGQQNDPLLHPQYYTAVHECTQSDHRPVVGTYEIELKRQYVHLLDHFLDITPPTLHITGATFLPFNPIHRQEKEKEAETKDDSIVGDSISTSIAVVVASNAWKKKTKNKKEKTKNKKNKNNKKMENNGDTKDDHEQEKEDSKMFLDSSRTSLCLEFSSSSCVSGISSTDFVVSSSSSSSATSVCQYVWNEDLLSPTVVPLSVDNATWL